MINVALNGNWKTIRRNMSASVSVPMTALAMASMIKRLQDEALLQGDRQQNQWIYNRSTPARSERTGRMQRALRKEALVMSGLTVSGKVRENKADFPAAYYAALLNAGTKYIEPRPWWDMTAHIMKREARREAILAARAIRAAIKSQ
jgi:hypothetical protein